MKEHINHPKLGKIPSDWKASKLSEIVNLIHGYQFRTEDFTDDGIAVIKIGNVMGNGLKLDNLSFIDSNRLEEFSQYIIKENEILMSLTGNIGRVIEVGSMNRDYLQNYRVGKFEPVNSFELSRSYIKYLLSSPLVLGQFFKFSNKSAQANFGKQDMDKVWVTIPISLPEQQKIAEILGAVDAKIDVIEQQISETEELKKGLNQHLFTKGIGHTEFKDSPLGNIPKSWDVVRIEEIAKVKGGKRLPKGKNLIEDKTNHPYIRVADMVMGGVQLDKILYVPDDVYPLIKQYTISKDDLFISVAGTLGIVGQIPPELDGANLTENADKLTDIKINKSFLLQLLLSPIIQDAVKSEQTNNAQPKLALSRIREFLIPKPSSSEQFFISELLNLIDSKLILKRQKKIEYQELKNGLMQQLLTGKVRVNNLVVA